jgi:hypothetical protein
MMWIDVSFRFKNSHQTELNFFGSGGFDVSFTVGFWWILIKITLKKILILPIVLLKRRDINYKRKVNVFEQAFEHVFDHAFNHVFDHAFDHVFDHAFDHACNQACDNACDYACDHACDHVFDYN